MAIRRPPPVSGLSGANLDSFVTDTELTMVCDVLVRIEPLDDKSMQAQANTVNFALLDYLTAIRSRESRSAPGAVREWADHISTLIGDLLGSLDVGGPRHAHLEAWQILRSALPRESDAADQFQMVKNLIFQCAPKEFQRALQDKEHISNREVFSFSDMIAKRAMRDLALLGFLADRASRLADAQIRPPGGGRTDHDRRRLMRALLPVYEAVSGRKPSGHNLGGPTIRWFIALFEAVGAKVNCPDELRNLRTHPKTVGNWINDALRE